MTSPDVLSDSATPTQHIVGARVAGALSRARVEPIADPEGFFADVSEVWAASGFEETPEEALIDLAAGREGWVNLKVTDGDDDIPCMKGCLPLTAATFPQARGHLTVQSSRRACSTTSGRAGWM